MGSGTLIISVIAVTFVFLAGRHFGFKANAEKAEKADSKDESDLPGVPPLTATRESFDDFMVELAPAPKQKPVAQKKVGPRGATKVTPDIDYSVFDVPTFMRREIQLSF
ncbi:hypothetical protein ACRCPS_18165 [Pseudomonas aeruginosa]